MLSNFLSTATAEQLIAEPDALSVTQFSGAATPAPSIPCSRVAQITEQAGFEVWKEADGIVERGMSGNCIWSRSEHLQFIAYSLPLGRSGDFEKTTKVAYDEILSFIEKSPHVELVRFWNYIPHINHGSGDQENYKRFCSGRLAAFTQHDLQDQHFPAASAVGHYIDGITIYALTASSKPTYHANPRQVDAFSYPRQYGPSSPSFARACTIDLADQHLCFISGTASILGHDSVHQGDLRLQLYTTNDNILYLLQETGFHTDSIQTLRVYLRDPNDYHECKSIVEELYPNANAIFTHADICRADLLVEIECFCTSA
jgi:chorismate lyase/3-hydroxybenzoate synthase